MAEMHTLAERDEALETFTANVDSVIAERPAVFSADLKSILKKSLEDGRGNAGFREFILERIDNLVKSCVPTGVPVPQHTVRVNVAEVGDDYRVDILLGRNNASFVDNFRFERRWLASDMTVESVVRFYESAYRSLINMIMAKSNLVHINDVMARIGADADVQSPYSVSYVLRSESGAANSAFLGAVSDTEIEFLVSTDKALEASDYALFGTAVSDEEMEELDENEAALAALRNRSILSAREAFADFLRSSTRPVDLLVAKPSSVKAMTGIGTHRAHALIAKSVGRKVEGLRRSIRKDVNALVSKDGVIGIVARDGETGEFSVVLSAMDAATLEPSDFDLIAYAESQIKD